MHLFLLLLDGLISGTYLLSILSSTPERFTSVLILMLFFLAFRTLSLAWHPLFSIINILLIAYLWQDNGVFLLIAYSIYAVIYFYALSREKRLAELEEQNRLLQLSNQSLRQLSLMQEQLETQRAQTLLYEERSRIAQSIHDMLGHSLVAALLQLEAASSLKEKDPTRSFAMVEKATTTMREGVEHIRGAVREMNTPVSVRRLSQLELLIEELQTRTGRPIHLLVKGEAEKVPYAYWAIFRAQLEESLSNSVRHSTATELFVRLEVLPRHVRFEVKDNGEGGVIVKPGMGIESMKERALSVGGNLLISTEHGVSVTSLLPLEES